MLDSTVPVGRGRGRKRGGAGKEKDDNPTYNLPQTTVFFKEESHSSPLMLAVKFIPINCSDKGSFDHMKKNI